MSNLALNKPARASGYVAPFAASRAVDGTLAPTRRWLCHAMPCSLEVDLGAPYWIDKWIVKHMGAVGWWSSDYNMKDYKLQGSMDKSKWVDLDTVVNNFAGITNRTFTAAQVRYVRVYMTAGMRMNQGVASILELEIYESSYKPYLLGLAISSGILNPVFSQKTFSYTVQVEENITSVRVTPTAEAANANIKVDGEDVASGTPSEPIILGVGDKNIPIIVTTGPVNQSYTIKVIKQKPEYLSGLVLNGPRGITVGMEPVFKESTFNYIASTSVPSVTVTPTAKETSSIIKVNNVVTPSGQPSQSISLNPGINTITIQVTPKGGGSLTTYIISVTKS
ncbi:cadherin-like beta sandwich domain-containing protein [Clostridium formicaceticum]|uniref:Cadherin-like beta sandwich domain protein n=1 Tax=Clostridium formicaceticum TaxID=1497 RepID=A0AAC9RN43_9CLOT|nr:cadherin-like beta sandwich domain-containing protein [Clostridium formicaceticum]AOY77997.1 hypothetical protein BJL90_20290 [Clostridium formicaceticum]ARE88627.1 Cadherin-like beta sandwich domain protein [Clostridium formicaceticum]